jgi:plasmid stability protein
VRAASHGRSTAAELRHIITETVMQQSSATDEPVRLGTLLAEIGRSVNLTDEEFAIFESVQVSSPARVASFD